MDIDIELIIETYIYFLNNEENNSPLTISIRNKYQEYIQKYIQEYSNRDILKAIELAVSMYYNISVKLLQKKTKKREIVQARQLEMYFARELTNLSFAKIGMRYGNKDHATVLHACKTVNNLIDTDVNFRYDCRIIRHKLLNK